MAIDFSNILTTNYTAWKSILVKLLIAAYMVDMIVSIVANNKKYVINDITYNWFASIGLAKALLLKLAICLFGIKMLTSSYLHWRAAEVIAFAFWAYIVIVIKEIAKNYKLR